MSWAGLCPAPPGRGVVARAGRAWPRDVSFAGVGTPGQAPGVSRGFRGWAHECAGSGAGRPGTSPGMAGEGTLRPGALRSALRAGSAPRHLSAARGTGVHRRARTRAGTHDMRGSDVYPRAAPAVRRPPQWQQLEPVFLVPVRPLRRCDGVGWGVSCAAGRS